MAVKISSYKNWCTDNISPQSWPRILLRTVDLIRAEGFTLKDFENPDVNADIPPRILEALNIALEELYETSVEESLLVRY